MDLFAVGDQGVAGEGLVVLATGELADTADGTGDAGAGALGAVVSVNGAQQAK